MGIKNIIGELQINGSKVLIEDDLSQIGGADWNIADESLPGAIKNKPFGYVRTAIVDVENTFKEPNDGANALIGYFPPNNLVNGQAYDVYLDNELLWQSIEWPFNDSTADGTINIGYNQIVIQGKSEEETHSIKIVGNITKKLDSEWLNGQTLPNASSDILDGVALVVKNGEWVISNTPVADKSDIMRLSGVINSIIEDLDEINRNPVQILDEIFTNFTYMESANQYVSFNETSPCVLKSNTNYLVKIDDISYTVTSTESQGVVRLSQEGIFGIDYNPQPIGSNYGFVFSLDALSSDSSHLQIFGDITLKEWQSNIENSLASIDEALDRIIEIQKELIGVALITFTIDGIEYQAEEGMTWGEWIDSDYNTIGCYAPDGSSSVWLDGAMICESYGGAAVMTDHVINPAIGYVVD